MSIFNYLYKIEYIGNKKIEGKYYIGSRKSKVKPEDDLLKRYNTSSKIVKKIIKEEGKGVFKIAEIKILGDKVNIFYEESKWLSSVDAKNNPIYFNQTNNEAYMDKANVSKICPWCNKKNYGNPFEKCSWCGNTMIEYPCNECGHILKHSCERCEKCNYRVMDDVKYSCKKCDNILNHMFEVCYKCGYSASKDSNYRCKKCGEKINNPAQKCHQCGYSIVDDFKYYCSNCGNRLNHSLERCNVCGTFERDKFNFKCSKCKSPISNSTSRCAECGYSVIDYAKFKCNKCNNRLENPMERCKFCGYSRREDSKHFCKNCGKEGLINSSSRCTYCGIIKAGCNNWRKYNEIYDLILNDKIIFTDFKQNCIDYLIENLVAGKSFLNKSKFFQGNPFEPKSKNNKYINQEKFKGLRAIKRVRQ